MKKCNVCKKLISDGSFHAMSVEVFCHGDHSAMASFIPENKEEKCNCKESSCKDDCNKNHTCKTFWCEKCEPVYPPTSQTLQSQSVPMAGIVPPQTLEWEEDIENFANINELYLRGVNVGKLKSFIKKVVTQAEERGRRQGIEEVKNFIKDEKEAIKNLVK